MKNEEKGILIKLRNIARSKSQKCYNPSCNNEAIRSHIQQKKGPIREISSHEGTIVQLEDVFPPTVDTPYIFKEKGINKGDVLTFWGFCNTCDSTIFKTIESGEIDYESHRNQLLFSYRGFLSEYYKQEYNIKWYELIFESKELSDKIKIAFETNYNHFKLISKINRYNKLLLERDLDIGTKNFEFLHFKLPKLEVCTSTSYCLPFQLNKKQLTDLKNKEVRHPVMSSIFINLIPIKSELIVILGCHSNKKLKGSINLKSISELNQTEKIKLISDLLIKHIETWFVSKSLYEKWQANGNDLQILEQIKYYLPMHMKSGTPQLNMFEKMYEK